MGIMTCCSRISYRVSYLTVLTCPLIARLTLGLASLARQLYSSILLYAEAKLAPFLILASLSALANFIHEDYVSLLTYSRVRNRLQSQLSMILFLTHILCGTNPLWLGSP
jgi:hypothetical protein